MHLCGGSYVRGLYLHTTTDIKQSSKYQSWFEIFSYRNIATSDYLLSLLFRALLEREETTYPLSKEFLSKCIEQWHTLIQTSLYIANSYTASQVLFPT